MATIPLGDGTIRLADSNLTGVIRGENLEFEIKES
jgi:hypothetical protein